jgi:hypothetical protein
MNERLFAFSQHKAVAFVCSLCFFASGFTLGAQNMETDPIQIAWQERPEYFWIAGESVPVLGFSGALFGEEVPGIPFFTREFFFNAPRKVNPVLLDPVFEPYGLSRLPSDSLIGEQISFRVQIEKASNQWVAKVFFVPVVKRGAGYLRLKSFRLRLDTTPLLTTNSRGTFSTETSVLASGDLYKLAIRQTGIYKLTYSFLKDQLKIPIDQVNPARIRLYGNGGGMLPESLLSPVPDDLQENAIQIVGAADGRFDPQDYILFYGQGLDQWAYDPTEQSFRMQKHLYDTRAYYFLKIDTENGKRLSEAASLDGASYTSNAFDDFARFEEDKVNLMHAWDKSQGSGKKWYGDHFRNARSYTYNDLFNFPNPEPGGLLRIRAEMAIRSLTRSTFTLRVNGNSFQSQSAARVSRLTGVGDNEVDYAKTGVLELSTSNSRADIDCVLEYPFPAGSGDGSEAWLDYIEANTRRLLVMSGTQLSFRDTRSLTFPITRYVVSQTTTNMLIWDVTSPLNPQNQSFSRQGSDLVFGAASDLLRTFVVFDPTQNLLSAEAIGRINNQNLHGIKDPDMLIVYHPDFANEARLLQQHRSEFDQLRVDIAALPEIYNEFASGAADPAAIRNLARMCYERAPNFRYLLLLGDGSFDPRNIYELSGDFIPVYQTESFNPIFAFPSDDFFAILEPASLGDPNDPLSGRLDIAVGRLPVNTTEQARFAVEKIIRYDKAPDAFSNWRNQLSFIGDDEDGQRHMLQADEIAGTLESLFPVFNLEKIYLDAFTQVSTPGGERYPEVNAAINQAIFRGNLVMTYLGHGGSQGLAQERILNITDIRSWRNTDRMPLFVTATCSFTGYDDAGFTTAGEEVFLNPNGGAFALMTTTRAVLSSQNKLLTEQVLLRLFERDGGAARPIGLVMQLAKNSFTGGGILSNSRKFTLIGDPSQRLAIPGASVNTTAINAASVRPGEPDTLKALQRITIQGNITGLSGEILEDFNGTVYPTLFDKKTRLSTLGQDRDSPVKSFDVQRNVIFKGKATVTRGVFSFTFVVPKDINFEPGFGKISYYAANPGRLEDAHGAFDQVVIGGTDPNALSDNQGPEIRVYMNTEDFVFGGITDPDPTLLVLLSDANGINVVGNSIGHDLEAILDNNTQQSIVLNDYYSADQDNFTTGRVAYPLTKLEPGRHHIQVKAWDVANNASEAATEFVVFDGEGIRLEHVLNYPNPFTDQTCFQFDHNYAQQSLDIVIRIFTISGRQVKTLREQRYSDGALRLDDCISWDGTDDYGDKLARGVYLYKVLVETQVPGLPPVRGESDFEKLVILK